jgi:peptidyl-tRNA hydrolase
VNENEVKRVLVGTDEIVQVLGHRRLSTGLTVAETLSGLTSIIASLASRQFSRARCRDLRGAPDEPAQSQTS